MGAVPGGRVLSDAGGPGTPSHPFDVEPFRSVAHRRVVVREVPDSVLVLGSTQSHAVVDPVRARRAGVTVARRRSGGGAVLLVPGAQLWFDIWVPRADPWWSDDPRRSAERVGEWWATALGAAGVADLRVHRVGSAAAPGSDVVCFAGVGPGEVVAGGSKLVGLAQWRGREGALVHACAYRRWDPRPLVDLLAVDDDLRHVLDAVLPSAATGLDDVGAPSFGVDALLSEWSDGPPWDVVRA